MDSIFLVVNKETGEFWQKHRQKSYTHRNGRFESVDHCEDFTLKPGLARVFSSHGSALASVPKELRNSIEVKEYLLVEKEENL